MEELIAMLMDLLMLKQNLVQSMELGENGVTGKHALHLAMAGNKSENVSVTAPSHNMVEMTVPLMAHHHTDSQECNTDRCPVCVYE